MTKRLNWRYALGELIIVTAGISLAFVLENLAQTHTDKKQALQYLANIKADVHADIAELDTNLIKLDGIAKAVDGYLPHLFQKLPGRDSIPGALFQKIHKYVHFFPHDATYQSMLHSGDFKLVTNIQLKNQIVEHYSSYFRLQKEIERHEHFAKTYTADYFMTKTNHALLFRNQQTEVLDDPYLKNLLFSAKGIFILQAKAHAEAKARCEKLAESIGKELARLD